MRTVTVEELEALADEAYALYVKSAALVQLPCDYDTCDRVMAARDYLDLTSKYLRNAAESRISSLASVRTDAEADKADAKRKEV